MDSYSKKEEKDMVTKPLELPVTQEAGLDAEEIFAMRAMDPNFKPLSGKELYEDAISHYDELMKLFGLEDEED